MATVTPYGQQFPDNYVKKNVIKKLIYHQADLISVGTKVIPTTNLDVLDVKFEYPSEMSGQYPVADDAVAAREKVTWSQFELNLKKGQVRYFITDSAKLRNMTGTQNVINLRRAAEALAKKKDNEILERLYAGAGATDVAAGTVWTDSSCDPEANVVDGWNTILDESNVNDSELKNMALIVPTKAFGRVNNLTLINNIQRSIKDYLGSTYGISIYPTRSTVLGTSSSTDALLLVKGAMTAQHGVLSDKAAKAAGVPLIESKREMGSGNEYLTTQWFRSGIVEDSSGTNTTYRILKITDVCA